MTFFPQDRYKTPEEFSKDWHKFHGPSLENSEMYKNGQFDEIPYQIWEDNEPYCWSH